MQARIATIVGAVLLLAAVASMSLFTVDQRRYAMVLQFGEVKAVVTEPGLHVKLPLVQNVRQFDRRLLTIDTPEPERFITSEKKNVLVDHFIKWRIVDPQQYYITMGGDETRARTRLLQTVNATLREEFGQRTVHDVVSGERDKVMEIVRTKTDRDARTFGVEIVDLRLKRVDLPAEVSESVYRRMEAERKRVANNLRSEGAAIAERIRADADRQSELIIAEAYRESQRIKGEGDAEATRIFNEAYGRDPDFFSYYRSLEAYRESFARRDDVLVLDPSSSFFKYFKAPQPAGGR
ncbi:MULTISPECIES: protease modulator HflC [Tepidiphilus]|jgi:membrane protease subunit HflC|uniref:Protein HflC n=1 Tax=Tepidiphilus thermophilus TaxID=876478 RepID=A0A0K6IYD1_9PROT|nr:modulator of FtsH protease HflC [Tepidiphilus sp.]CUB08078.1 Regulator of protease activity HflC, stomatin/prohibitin superfamily [Tepidiphilus thermophilus]